MIHRMTTRTAQCACGRVEITVENEPRRIVACHCDFCQKRTGSVFGVLAYFIEEQVVEVSGETKIYNGLEIDGVAATGGYSIDYHFCATCGSTVYWDFVLRDGHREIGVAVGNFVDPDFPVPTFESNTTLRHRWVPLVPGADQFDSIPTA